MGVLDDAIREHLELKRQHGASRRTSSAPGGRGARAGAPRGGCRGDPRTRAAAGPGGGRAGGIAARRGCRSSRPEPEDRRRWRRRRPSAVAGSRRAEALEPQPGEPSAAGAGLRALAATRRRPSPWSTSADRVEDSTPSQPERGARAPTPEAEAVRATTPTCSRRRPTSCRRRRSTTGSGSSRSRRATSTSTRQTRMPGVAAGAARPGEPPHCATQRRPVPLDSTEPSMPS